MLSIRTRATFAAQKTVAEFVMRYAEEYQVTTLKKRWILYQKSSSSIKDLTLHLSQSLRNKEGIDKAVEQYNREIGGLVLLETWLWNIPLKYNPFFWDYSP